MFYLSSSRALAHQLESGTRHPNGPGDSTVGLESSSPQAAPVDQAPSRS
jgi:hypothetical protein